MGGEGNGEVRGVASGWKGKEGERRREVDSNTGFPWASQNPATPLDFSEFCYIKC